MRGIKSVFALAAFTAVMLAAPSLPAAAEASEDSIVFFPVPLGNGATYSCTGGPPFVVDQDDSTGNCSVQRIGAPVELVCGVPTTITFVHDMHRFVADANLCR